MNAKLQMMLDTIREEAKYTASFTGRKQFSSRVMQAIAHIDREHFVTKGLKDLAYDDNALPIGHGQTISQPYIVALMTDLLDLTPESKVLEIGTGSGYQAAILSQLAKQVYSIEKIPPLAEKAKQQLRSLQINNVEIRCGNGYFGWPDKSPFDAIIVTAAATHIPDALVQQLTPMGRMVIPVGLPDMHQELMLVCKNEKGVIDVQPKLGVIFVPLVDDPEFHRTTKELIE